jgi:hypothetical protein
MRYMSECNRHVSDQSFLSSVSVINCSSLCAAACECVCANDCVDEIVFFMTCQNWYDTLTVSANDSYLFSFITV